MRGSKEVMTPRWQEILVEYFISGKFSHILQDIFVILVKIECWKD